jgi:NAD(P)-dependent dehydrogenase (short-subunit alcohol dehydrogenase family)
MAGETKHSGTWSSLCSLSQPKLPPTPPETTFKDQTVLITGGNSGLGYETARRCLILQARRVIITVRSKAKGQDAISRLQNDSSVHKTNPMALIEAYELDLDDYQSTILFVNKVKHELTELDVLLCNAGINVFEHQMSKSGHERHLQGTYTVLRISLMLPIHLYIY